MNELNIKLASTFGGVEAHHPEKGDWVKVVEGQRMGEILQVVLVDGYVFSPAYKVYVQASQGELLWYWPWNLEILPNH